MRSTAPDSTLSMGRSTGAWLMLALAAIAAATCFAAGLVLTRIPGFGALFPLRNAFPAFLTLHVDFSSGVWFLAMASVLWSLALAERGKAAGTLPVWITGMGMLAMGLAPIGAPQARAILSDYFPVLDHPMFLAGSSFVLLGWTLVAVGAALSLGGTPDTSEMPADSVVALRWAAAIGLMAILTLGVGWVRIESEDWRPHYSNLVWGPGHLLQVMQVLLVLAVWLWLARLCGRRPLWPKVLRRLPVLIAIPTIVSAFALTWPSHFADGLARFAYTGLMAFAGSVSLISVLAHAFGKRRVAPDSILYSNLLDASLLLYSIGIGLGFLIHDNSTLVPAHYHGAIGGITLAYMGVAYRLVERSKASAWSRRWALWQVRAYGIGMLVMIVGLVMTGLPRKSNDLWDVAHHWSEATGVTLTAIGGSAALAGSFGFIGIAICAMRGERRRTEDFQEAGQLS